MGHHCVSPEMEHILCVQKRSCPLRGLRELKWAISIQKQIKGSFRRPQLAAENADVCGKMHASDAAVCGKIEKI